MEKLDFLRNQALQNSPKSSLFVVPTSRSKREIYKNSEGFVQKTLTTSEFEQRAVFVENRTLIDETTRMLLLRKASEFREYEKLNIDRDFLVFLEHAPFFLRFFDELFSEKVEIDDLLIGDLYAEYDDHISILKTLLYNYQKLLEQNNYIDRAFLHKNYLINSAFIKEFEEITIVLDGAFTSFEKELIEEIAKLTQLYLVVEINEFDQKNIELFSDFELQVGYKYTLDISSKTILEQSANSTLNPAKIYTFKNRVLQAAAVIETIYKLVENGTDIEKIAVILPDENFAKVLKSFDRYNNLNLSMGNSFKNSNFFELISALYISTDSTELANQLFFKRVSKKSEEIIKYRDIFADQNKITADQIIAELNNLLEFVNDDEIEIVSRAIKKLELVIKTEKLTLKNALYLLIEELKNASFDDIDGGKVTVMGALESRGAVFDAVIVVDFNEDFVPVTNIKDMFLNTLVRKTAKLPTRYDRENLQRSLYYKLFARVKNSIIFCVDNDSSKPSRFLEEIFPKAVRSEFIQNTTLLFAPKNIKKVEPKEIECEIDLTKEPLSNSKFKTYLECKRKFYYKYIKKYYESEELEEQSDMRDIGNILHNSLKNAFLSGFDTADELNKKIITFAKTEAVNSRINFELDLWQKRLTSFCENEYSRKISGVKPKYLEESFKTLYNGINIYGKIDRVDEMPDQLVVLDYKTGKNIEIKSPEKTVDFQLIFYYLLLKSSDPKEIVAGYYNLENGEILYIEEIEKYIEFFDKYLQDYANKFQQFSQTDSKDICRFCSYQILCKRYA